MNEYLLLKWGTLKGWSDLRGNEAACEALHRFHADPVPMSAAMHRNTDAQKQALCELIDAVDGEIVNDWSGETMTKEEAKEYVLGYDR